MAFSDAVRANGVDDVIYDVTEENAKYASLTF